MFPHGTSHARTVAIVVVGKVDVSPTSARVLAFARDDGSVARMAIVRDAMQTVGRYVVGPKIGAGGMASVHLGRLRGSAGFARTVAIKRLLPKLARDPELVARFLEEARIVSRIRHANVIPTIDVVDAPEVLLVLEYVHGESLACLLRLAASRGRRCPPSVASAIVVGVLRGLHVAHDAKGTNGVALDLVHRDVSPQNVLVGADGVARMLDFGIAKAAGHEESTINRANGTTRDLRGKLAYMAPEQASGEPVDRRADLFAAGVMLWETLAGDRLFKGDDAVTTMQAIFHRDAPRLSAGLADVPPRVDEVLASALAKDAEQRFATADDMARAIEVALPPASDRLVADWVESLAAEILTARTAIIARFEGSADAGGEDERSDATTEKRSPVVSDAPASAMPVHTPMAMVAPANDPLAASGMTSTRIGAIDPDVVRARQTSMAPPLAPTRTPIPMPMPEPKRRGISRIAGIAAVIALPAAVAGLLLVASHARAAASAAEASANAGPPPAAVSEDLPPSVPPPLRLPPPIAGEPPAARHATTPATSSSTPSSSTPSSATASSSAPAPSRGRRAPHVRSPRRR